MLSSPHRLKQSRPIARVFSRGQSGTSGPVTVRAAGNGAIVSRAVVIVSKKVSKRAVVRNRVRRRLGAMLADSWETVAPGYDIVITVHRDIAEEPIKEIVQHLTEACRRAKVISSS